jgi:hypothetical protein
MRRRTTSTILLRHHVLRRAVTPCDQRAKTGSPTFQVFASLVLDRKRQRLRESG